MAFRIDINRFLRQLGQIWLCLRENKSFRFLQSTIEINRADQRFERVRQGRYPRASTARFLAPTHQQELSEIERGGMGFQCVTRDQARAQFRQLSLRLIAEMPKKIFRHHELQDRVAQKFQALIIKMTLLGLMAEARMGQRLGQQKWIAEFVTDSFFQRMHVSASDKFRAKSRRRVLAAKLNPAPAAFVRDCDAESPGSRAQDWFPRSRPLRLSAAVLFRKRTESFPSRH